MRSNCYSKQSLSCTVIITLFSSLSIKLTVTRERKCHCTEDRQKCLRIISFSKIWMHVTSIKISLRHVLKKEFLCECLVTNLIILWKLLIPCAFKRKINKSSELPSRNQSRIMHLFLQALICAWALCGSSDKWITHPLLMELSRREAALQPLRDLLF